MKNYLFFHLPNSILLIIVAACVAKSSIPTSEKATIQPSIVGSSPPTSKPTNSSTAKPIVQVNNSLCNSKFNLDDWIALRNLSMSEVQKRFSMTEAHIEHGVGYEKITNATMLHNPKTHPGFFFFKDSKLVMLLIHPSDCPQIRQLNMEEIKIKLGTESVRLPSKADLSSSLYVYPQKGFAFSSSFNSEIGIEFIEIFQPMSIEEYKAKIYTELPPYTY